MTEPIRLRDLALAAFFFLAATLVYTFPLALAPAELNRFDSPDALLNAWIVSWNLTQLVRDPLHLFDANIFHPETGTLAYSENLLTGSLLVAPVRIATSDPVLLFNAVVVLAFVLTGVSAFWLAYDVTSDRLAALLAGTLFAFAPYRFAHIPHLQLLLAFGVPLSLLWARRLAIGPGRPAAACGFAVAAFATFGSSVYYAVFVLAAAPILFATELTGVPARERRTALATAAAACLGAGLLTLPVALPYVDKLQGGSVRSLAAAEQFSAGLTEYLSSFSCAARHAPQSQRAALPRFRRRSDSRSWRSSASPPPSATAGGMDRDRAPRRGALHGTRARAVHLPLSGGAPVPRAPRAVARRRPRAHRRGAPGGDRAVAIEEPAPSRGALLVVAAAESLAAPLPLRRELPSYPPIYRHVEALEGGDALVELPLPPPERFQDNAIYVYRSILPRAPPRQRLQRLRAGGLSRGVPAADAAEPRDRGLAHAYEEGVRHVLAHEGRLGPRMRRQIREMILAGTLRLVAEEGSDRLYAIEPGR